MKSGKKLGRKLALTLGILTCLGVTAHAASSGMVSANATLPSSMGYTYAEKQSYKAGEKQNMTFQGANVPISVNMCMMNEYNAQRSERLTCPAGSTTKRYAPLVNGASSGHTYQLRLNTSSGQTNDYYMTGQWSSDQY